MVWVVWAGRKVCFLLVETEYALVGGVEFGGANFSFTVCAEAVDRLTVSTALVVPLLPSTTLTSLDRKSVVEGKSVDLGGRRIIKKKKLVAGVRFTRIVSSSSPSTSPRRATVSVWLVW